MGVVVDVGRGGAAVVLGGRWARGSARGSGGRGSWSSAAGPGAAIGTSYGCSGDVFA